MRKILWALVAAEVFVSAAFAQISDADTRMVTDPNTGVTYQLPAPHPKPAQNTQPQNASHPAAKPAGVQSASLSYQPWRDPAEGAFTVSLPRGWQISGGTVRTTRIEPHYVIHAQSPSGGVQLFFDDPQIAIRQVPGMMTQRMGWREGQVIPAAWGGKLLLKRYEPAPRLAEEYASARLCSGARDFEGGIIPAQTEALGREMGEIARAEGKQVRVDVGEVSFRCGERSGYVYAITLLASQPGQPVSLWLVYRIAGYLSTPAESAQAAAAMHTLLGSFQMDQQWLGRFARESNDMAGNVIRESNAITQSTIERARRQDADQKSQFDAWRKNSQENFNAIEKTNRSITGVNSGGGSGNGHSYNAQLGTKEVCDELDRCQSVDASIDNWYSDCTGTFYPGSPSGDKPSSQESACWHKGR